MYENELYHHGIKGQRWGVRRYQNEDGSLKPAGEGRYDDGLRGRARRKAAKSYNYRQGESYKSMSSNEKRKRSNTYNFNKKFYGKKAANRMEYEVDRGADRNKLQKKAFAKKNSKDNGCYSAYGRISIHNQRWKKILCKIFYFGSNAFCS